MPAQAGGELGNTGKAGGMAGYAGTVMVAGPGWERKPKGVEGMYTGNGPMWRHGKDNKAAGNGDRRGPGTGKAGGKGVRLQV